MSQRMNNQIAERLIEKAELIAATRETLITRPTKLWKLADGCHIYGVLPIAAISSTEYYLYQVGEDLPPMEQED